MDAQLIEILDRQQYRILLGGTVSFGIVLPALRACYYYLNNNETLFIVSTIVAGLGVCLGIVTAIFWLKYQLKMIKEPELYKAMRNELIIL